jgi:2-phosphosulfolactate phosphatase
MSPQLDVAFLPSIVHPEKLTERVVVVIDILRATTTIISALNSGASCVIPSPSIMGARQLHERMGEGSVLGGERGGKKVEGFHCGNSPREYTEQAIQGKSLILATTNGTLAMEKCRLAKAVLIGAFVNMAVIAKRILNEPKTTLLCSGTDGHVTSEDILFAGALTEQMLTLNADLELKDSAEISLSHWRSTQQKIRSDNCQLADFMRVARGGKNLVRIGLDHDIVFSSQIDTIPIVPALDIKTWTIRVEQ